MTCNHGYKDPVRKGRAHYVCRKCGQDITMELVLIAQADFDSLDTKEAQELADFIRMRRIAQR